MINMISPDIRVGQWFYPMQKLEIKGEPQNPPRSRPNFLCLHRKVIPHGFKPISGLLSGQVTRGSDITTYTMCISANEEPWFCHPFECKQKQQGSQLASCRAVFCAGFHVVTSTTHGVHMDTTWHPCGNPVVSCRNHIVSTFETLCCPPGNHIVSTWKPNGVHLETTWCAHGNHIICTWQPCSEHRNYMVSVWKPCGGHMETMWFSHGNYVVSIFESTYCPSGNHMVSTWKVGGVHLDTIWC